MSAPGPQTSRLPVFRLLVISGGTFAAVSSEFLPTGLLVDMARDLTVSESTVGLLVTAFAATVVVFTVPVTHLTRMLSRKWLMVAALGTFALANGAVALSPSYGWVLAARIVGGVAHGIFWSVTGPYATRMVPRAQLSRALAIVNGGGTLAFVLGVPFTTALGHALGWRLAFAAMGGIVAVFLLLVVLFLPPVEHRVTLATGEIPLPLRRDPTVRRVLIVCLVTLLIITGHNTLYTYIAPWVIGVGGVAPDAVSALLLAFGVAGAVGLLLAGAFGDRFPRGTISVMFAGVIASVVALALLGPGNPVAVALGLFAWSASFGGIPALIQGRIQHTASPRLRDTASAWTTISFNIAIGVGALLGGRVLDTLGLAALPWALVGIVAIALALLVITDARRSSVHP